MFNPSPFSEIEFSKNLKQNWNFERYWILGKRKILQISEICADIIFEIENYWNFFLFSIFSKPQLNKEIKETQHSLWGTCDPESVIIRTNILLTEMLLTILISNAIKKVEIVDD